MIARKREEQKQSARMVLRNNDHRDIIRNDIYHYFIWAKTADIEDKLIWQKYPRKSLVFGATFRLMGWMDVERQFQFAQLAGGSAGNNGYYHVDGLLVYIYYYSDASRTTLFSEDGMIYKNVSNDAQVGKPIVPYSGETAYIGTKGICNVHNPGGNTTRIEVSRFDYSEELEKWLITTVTSSVNRPNGAWWVYWGATADGAIIEYNINVAGEYDTPIYDQYFYLWGYSGERTLMRYVEKVNYPSHTASGSRATYSSARCGNISCRICIHENAKSRYGGDWIRIHTISTTIDNGANFYQFSPEGEHTIPSDSYFSANAKCGIFVRGAVFYAIWGINYYDANSQRNPYQVVMYKSTNGISWTKVDLPAYVDVKLIHTGGAGVGRRAEDTTLRIAIDPNNAPNYNVRLHDMISVDTLGAYGYNNIDANEYNIMYKDGEYSNKDFYLVLHGKTNYVVYFDNENLSGENCFAWTIDINVRDQSGVTGLADVVQEDDYCAPIDFGMVVDDADPVGYNYYIWDNDSYTKVYSTTPYAHHYVVIVAELPAQGAVNVLYKVPYYLAMTDWTDNVDYGE